MLSHGGNSLLAVEVGTDPKEYTRKVRRAWERFICGIDTAPPVRPPIVHSWRRCLSAGVDAARAMAPTLLDCESTASQWKNHPLHDIVEDLLSGVVETAIHQTSHLFVVADPQGVILRIIGDPALRRLADRFHFVEGASWLETEAGSNAIGTALASGEPVQMLAAEHYCEHIQIAACSCAPVRDPETGQVVAFFDLTSLNDAFQPLALFTAMSLARTAESYLKTRSTANRHLLVSRYAEVAARNGAPAAVCDRGGRVIRAAPFFHRFGLVDKQGRLTGVPVDLVLTAADPMEVETSTCGNRHRLLVQAVRAEGQVIGCLVRLAGPEPGRAGRQPGTRIREQGPHKGFAAIIGRSAPLQDVLRRAAAAAESPFPILITGESGTGKDLLAHAIHAASKRAAGPFVSVNCAAVPQELLASELFGYAPGAYTGANRSGFIGRFRQADGGTIFLDEIGDMPPEAQVYLLKILEERKITPLGARDAVPIDVRIICATHRPLEAEIERGRFRADLYYRLNVIHIHMPPLRDRAEDIPLLAETFLDRARDELGKPPLALSPEAAEALAAYHWPGNVRELRNLCCRLALETAGPVVTPEDLPPELCISRIQAQLESASAPPPRGKLLKSLEWQAIQSALQVCGGSVSKAARYLGVNRSTIYRKLQRNESSHV